MLVGFGNRSNAILQIIIGYGLFTEPQRCYWDQTEQLLTCNNNCVYYTRTLTIQPQGFSAVHSPLQDTSMLVWSISMNVSVVTMTMTYMVKCLIINVMRHALEIKTKPAEVHGDYLFIIQVRRCYNYLCIMPFKLCSFSPLNSSGIKTKIIAARPFEYPDQFEKGGERRGVWIRILSFSTWNHTESAMKFCVVFISV